MKNKKIYLTTVSIVLLGLLSISFMSETLLNRLIQGLQSHRKANFQEKIYLHLDNPYYIAGEDIYFKGYITNAYTNIPGKVSNVMTDLYDSDNKLISTHKSHVKNGLTVGNISLPDTLKNGIYSIVSYTNWMKNYSKDFFFRKDIQIYGTRNNKIENKHNSSEIDLQFFPEGGYMVDSLLSTVAFKATNTSGEGIKIAANLYDNLGNKLDSISGNELGMGIFTLKPNPEEEYYVQLKNSDKKYKLPSQLKRGIVMSINNSEKRYLDVILEKQGILNKDVLIVFQSAGNIHYYMEIEVTPKGVYTSILKSKLPKGICQVTVFDLATQEPIIERMVYIDSIKPLDINVVPEKHEYTTREKVVTRLKVTDSKGVPVKACFSLSVSNRNSDMDADNIYSSLLLTSELKGKIERPNYYFQNNNPNAKRDLDYLMLTQGWRRFTWIDILNPKPIKHNYSFEMGGLFSVKNRLISNGNPVANKSISILLANKLVTYQSESNADGMLKIIISDFHGNETFLYKITEDVNKMVAIDNSFQSFSENKNFYSASQEKYYKKELQNHRITSSYKPKLLATDSPQYNYKFLYDKSINLRDYIAFSSMTEVFREILSGVLLRKNKQSEPEIILLYTKRNKKYESEPLYIVNGIPTFNTKYVLDLEPSIVESIGVINSPENLGRFGEFGKYGVIVINVKEDIAANSDEGTIKISGYDIVKEFYQPKYENTEIKNNSIPDFRSVLYWNPNVTTDENGEALVDFYTSDEVSNYHITVEGLSSTGQIGTLNQEFINVTLPTSMK